MLGRRPGEAHPFQSIETVEKDGSMQVALGTWDSSCKKTF